MVGVIVKSILRVPSVDNSKVSIKELGGDAFATLYHVALNLVLIGAFLIATTAWITEFGVNSIVGFTGSFCGDRTSFASVTLVTIPGEPTTKVGVEDP